MFKKVFYVIIAIATIVVIPFAIEKMILNETIFPFSLNISLSKEGWFGFIGSYIGAIGTVFLGIVALLQNKRYKALSDQSNDSLLKLQNEIKDLTEKNVKLIELNSKIEHAKYYPKLTELHYAIWDYTEGMSYYIEEKEIDSLQITFERPDIKALNTDSIDKMLKDGYAFTYLLKNDGESPIRNFICREVLINDNPDGFWVFRSCDINAGDILGCMLVTREPLKELLKSGEMQTITLVYDMENVLGDKYEMKTFVDFAVPGISDNPFEHIIEVVTPYKK